MMQDGFVKNNRGINDGQDLPREYLETIFDRIAGNEIKMKDEEEGAGGGAGRGEPQCSSSASF
jgi:brefeldin A-inhibited guanine nucleotide-exchange protein